MCFSATTSFVAGGALAAGGVATVRAAKSGWEIPLASIPLIFGVQQTVEGVVWLSFGTPWLNTLAAYAYTLFSHVFWPAFVPVAVLLIETSPARRKVLFAFSLLGAALSAYLLYLVTVSPVTAQVAGHSISYDSIYPHPWINVAWYFLAACGSCFVSSHRVINVLGMALLVSFAVAVWFYLYAFFSVWCFFAAILSAIVYRQITTH